MSREDNISDEAWRQANRFIVAHGPSGGATVGFRRSDVVELAELLDAFREDSARLPEAVRRWLGQTLPDTDYMKGTDERRIIVEWRSRLLGSQG